MKSRFANFIFVALAFFPGISFAQLPIKAVDDSLTVILGQAIVFNVTDNDSLNLPVPFQPDVAWVDIYPCIGLAADGSLSFLPDANICAGETLKYTYRYANCNDSISKCAADVKIDVKRIVNCSLIRMDDFIVTDSVDSPQCANVCENSGATFWATYNTNSTYTWSVAGGGIITPGVNTATVDIAWGEMGVGTVSLIITNGDVSTTITACVVIKEGPVADFTTSSTNICKNSSVTFDNQSTGGSSFYWDFGDGTISSASSVAHQYTTPGTHTACLIVTRNNYDDVGHQLCSCTDTLCVDIIVDALPGPNIFCVSTLCANDSTKYWTDAKNCGTYTWTVLAADGSSVAFNGQNTPMIFVQWGAGPVGTVTLEVTNCDDLYCLAPVTVTIPIISPTVMIAGKTSFCENAVETYTAPKWMGVYYHWQVTGGTILLGEGTNTITVKWGGPGTGTITLNYYSDFLGGLPGQDTADCMGTAMLNVDIKADFKVFTQPKTVVCANHVSTYTAVPFSNYNWTVTGGPIPSVQITGPNTITVTWDSGPGNYTITAMPVNPNLFCNDVVTKFMQVVEVPLPWIDGPDTICPGQTYTYFAQTDQVGVGFNWSVNNGGIWSTSTVNPLTVTWAATGSYLLYLQQFMLTGPMCSSDTFSLEVKPKMIDSFAIDGLQLVCVNALLDYTANPAQQDPDASYTWTILDPMLGSVVNGQGTPNIRVQWNNVPDTAALTLTVELCDSALSISIPVIINAPKPISIAQKDTLCAAQDIMLVAAGGFLKYLWSDSATTQIITALANTVYTVTACDTAGCVVIATYDKDDAVVLTPPPSDPPHLIVICILYCNPAPMITISAPTGPGPYSYNWTLDGVDQFNMTAMLTHTSTCEKDTFVYIVTLTDSNGCTSSSTTTVIQTDLCDGGICNPAGYNLSFIATNQMPNCSIVNFEAMPINARIIGWDFGDLSGAGSAPNPILHTYTEVGDYAVTLYAKVLNTNQPPDSCTVMVSQTVHIPLKAEFSCTSSCSKVTFTDLTTHNAPGDEPINWSWAFGDDPLNSSMSTDTNPMFTYPGPGTYYVTLTVMNADSCMSVFTKEIKVGGVSLDTIAITPNTCVGVPLSFCGVNPSSNVVQWEWAFDDGATNGAPKPFHSYLTPGTYNVALTVTDAEGCTDMAASTVVVQPLPPYMDIIVTPGLSVCDSTEVMLMAPTGTDYTYLWSDSSTVQFIKTDSAGTYSVTITDANGCTMVPDPVTIVVYPTPQATISGNHYRCNNSGCLTLSAPYGQHYIYLWSTGETSTTISVCNEGVFTVMVTDTSTNLKCSAVSDSFSVFAAIAPSFGISIDPDNCEGVPVMLNVNNILPDVIYHWSNGLIGASITVTQAGTYFAFGMDTITGCAAWNFVNIYPLPDLCLVPVGCYEVCNPDTICGPSGLSSYQWNKDGIPISGETDACLIVTQSGTYSLTGTSAFGCTRTSDSLLLTVIDCTCYGLSASATPAGTDSCCWNLSYNNPLNTLYSLTIRSNDADLVFSSLSGPFSMALGVNSITLSNVVSGAPIGSGVFSDFISVCLSNVLNTPQQVIFDWYDVNNVLLCSDTVTLFSQKTLVDTIFLCSGETVSLGGGSYTAPDIVMITLPGAGGECDTLATYHLLLSPVHTITLNCPPNLTVNAVWILLRLWSIMRRQRLQALA